MSKENINQTKPFSFEAETRRDYLVTKEMKHVWACQLDLLQKLLQVCEKYHLRCWADAGTLIGAVREQGFIPWDDDIDVAMPREDYDKLVAIADQEFTHPYFFQTIYSDMYYNNRHAQVRNSDTAAIPTDGKKRKYNQGIFIDIFILDAYPKTGKEAYKLIKKLRKGKNMLKIAITLCNLMPGWLYKKFRLDIKYFRKYENILRATKLEDTEYVSCMSLNIKEKIRLKSDYEQTTYVPFENIQIPIPTGYDRLLRTDYGDYMTPTKAPTVHGQMNYDTQHSYQTK